MRYGLCCICLALQDRDEPLSFQTMTYKSFSSKDRGLALDVLGARILNNVRVTLEAIKYCRERGMCYRLSSDLFPLLTYDKAGVRLEDLPYYGLIHRTIGEIRSYISDNPVRISSHPDQFNVLASEDSEALDRTVRELNFQAWFMDAIGCPANYDSPINIHLNNNSGEPSDVVARFRRGLSLLDDNCRRRIVVENDDKPKAWSVKNLVCYLHSEVGCPITFDYLHHKCHPDGLNEEYALRLCHDTWGNHLPLFHYSESRDDSNPRAHADFPSKSPCNYGLDFDLDFEFKMKDKAIDLFESKLLRCA